MNQNAAFKNLTPAAKLAMVNNKLGNPGLKNNQGSTVEVFDYIDVTSTIGTSQTYNFFGAVNGKVFPYANIQQNQLQVGEALSVEYIAFTRLTVTTAGNIIQKQESLLNITALAMSQINFLLDNSRILKINSLTRANTLFNPRGATITNNLFFPDTNLTIPPQIAFTMELRTPINTDAAGVGNTVYYGCHLFGTGAILNLKTNV